MFAALLVVEAREVPPMITDQNMRMVPPPMRPTRRGMMSETHTATKFEKSWSVEEMAVSWKGSLWPISSK